jgi:hypothetical protein
MPLFFAASGRESVRLGLGTMAMRERHGQAVMRLAEVPGLGSDSAQKWIAEIGLAAAIDALDSQAGRPCGGEGQGHHF